MEFLKENPFVDGEDKYDPGIPTATLQIYKFIEKEMQRDSKYVNRASSANLCPKRRQFQRMGTPAKPIAPRVFINFLLGDLAEKTINYFLLKSLVGPGKLYERVDLGIDGGSFSFNDKEIRVFGQKTMNLRISDSLNITGHADGFGKRNSDGKWELIEHKSAANYGFKSFKENGPGDYLKQAHVLMMSDRCRELGIKQVRFFFLRKETGHIWDQLHSFDEKIADLVIEEFKLVESDKIIETRFPLKKEIKGRGKMKQETGRLIAQFPCSYCPFLEACHGKHEVEYKKDQMKSKKPTFIFKTENKEE